MMVNCRFSVSRMTPDLGDLQSGRGAIFKFTYQVHWAQRHELSRYSDCVAEHSECDLQPSEIIICCGINFLKDKGVGTSQTRDGR